MKNLKRRLIVAGALTLMTALAHGAEPTPIKPDFCMFLCNHWTYGDIGWSYGLKSCEQSVRDSLDMAERAGPLRSTAGALRAL